MSVKPKIAIYTDGACSGNPGPGGWGALLISDSSKLSFSTNDLAKLQNSQSNDNLSSEYSLQDGLIVKKIFGYEFDTTNNRMELKAAIEALKTVKKSCIIDLFTDSKYLQQGITQWIHKWIKDDWYKRDGQLVKNSDLWQELHLEFQHHDINWQWVKGHADNRNNQIADILAVKGKKIAMEKFKCFG